MSNIMYTFSEVFSPVLTGDFSLESGWQNVSSDLHDSSKYPC